MAEALRVHDDPHPALLKDFVPLFGCIQRHSVLKPRAPAFFDEETQPLRLVAFLGDERLELPHGSVSERDHAPMVERQMGSDKVHTLPTPLLNVSFNKMVSS